MPPRALWGRLPVTAVAILTYAVMAGYFTQSGVILGPAAAMFGRSITETAPLFSYLLGGNLAGIIVSLGIFDVMSIKRTLTCAYAVMFAGIALLALTHTFALASLAVALVGFGGGLGLSAGAVIISKSYAAHRRATAFLGTDCAFSLTGFVVPPLVAALIAHHFAWTAGYALVGVLAAAVLAIAAGVRFPAAATTGPATHELRAPLAPGAIVRITLFGLALSLYLCGQSVFLIWAPSYLQAVFAVPARDASNIVSSFWGPSIFGLIGAALIVTRVAPRVVLLVAMSATAVCLLLIATAPSAAAFFTLTLAFGFMSTCMYKLMISVGSEQIPAAPPRLVTFLLLAGSVGGTLAPVASAAVVHAFGPRGGPLMAWACYCAALVAITFALTIERAQRRTPLAVPAVS